MCARINNDAPLHARSQHFSHSRQCAQGSQCSPLSPVSRVLFHRCCALLLVVAQSQKRRSAVPVDPRNSSAEARQELFSGLWRARQGGRKALSQERPRVFDGIEICRVRRMPLHHLNAALVEGATRFWAPKASLVILDEKRSSAPSEPLRKEALDNAGVDVPDARGA